MKTNFSSEQEFIKTIALPAQKACKRYGYLPSVLIAQACLENGYGIPSYWDNSQIQSLLKYNNMIGQKAELLTSSWYDKSVWPGQSFNKNTPEVYSNQKTIIKDSFRIFNDIEQSFCDFILFLLYASNYGYNKQPKYGKEVVNIKDPKKLITEVSKRGYATDPNYAISVMKIINKHNLTNYDDLSIIIASNYIPDALKDIYKTTTGDNNMKITEKTIYDVTKVNLSQVPASRGNNPIQWIVIHYLGVANADNENLYGGGYGGHYYVSRAGKIYKAANPKTAVVWHCGGGLQGSGGHQYHRICTNYNSIGIENGVCYDGTWYFTKETQESLIYLVSQLMDEYNIDIDHVIRHYDVTGKICPAPYVNNDNYKTSWTWNQFKENLISYRNNNGNYTIPEKTTNTETTSENVIPLTPPFSVKVLVDDLNIRKGPGTNYSPVGFTGKGIFTIVQVSQNWGKLKSGAGWIYLKNPKYCTFLQKTYTFNNLDYSLVFDPIYYCNKYSDLKQAFGTDDDKLFNHFCIYGMKEGRQAISTFNVTKYKNYYQDLRKAFGSNLPAYYKHYIKFGKKEGRKAI